MNINVTAATLNRMATQRMEELDREIARLESALASAHKEYRDLYAIRLAHEGTIEPITEQDNLKNMVHAAFEAGENF